MIEPVIEAMTEAVTEAVIEAVNEAVTEAEGLLRTRRTRTLRTPVVEVRYVVGVRQVINQLCLRGSFTSGYREAK